MFKKVFKIEPAILNEEQYVLRPDHIPEQDERMKSESDCSDNPLYSDRYLDDTSSHNPRKRKQGRKPKPKPTVGSDVMDELESKTFDRVEIPAGHVLCCACFKSYSTWSALMEHGETAHRRNPPPISVKTHFCKICFRGYLTRRAIKEHREKVQRMVVYECRLCQMRLVNSVKRRTHAQNHDKKANIVTDEVKATLGKLCCAINCNCSFPTDELLMQHAQTVHKFNKIEADIGFNQERPIGCDICHKHFSTEKGLQQHRIRKYLPKRHQCSMCGEKFHSPSDLILHERIHRNERNVPCEVCPKRFYTAQQLKDHMRKHAAIPRFICNLCGKAFKQNKILHAHLLAHEGRLPYVCDVCNKGFRVKNKLTYHMRTHTGERPYPCSHIHVNGFPIFRSNPLDYTPPSPSSSSSSPSATKASNKTARNRRHHTNIIERRNQRERVRVRLVNEAFTRLRQMVPATRSSSKRVSKVKTLKRAVDYIGELRRRLATFESFLLTDVGIGLKSSQSSSSLSARQPRQPASADDLRWKTLPPPNYEPLQSE
ncbi:zinc finger protein ZFP2-like [Sabethes cyaneus]|uniref:zinc finger protein ZFP2-like n=1 Tax=Sabethes cyaneus TaxID=53552 RepID=UPI00237E0377|nr:zinc finger protein ZFP2-like [Sabethes cyaneus]